MWYGSHYANPNANILGDISELTFEAYGRFSGYYKGIPIVQMSDAAKRASEATDPDPDDAAPLI